MEPQMEVFNSEAFLLGLAEVAMSLCRPRRRSATSLFSPS